MTMITHEQYLKNKLVSLKLRLENVIMANRIHIAVHEEKMEFINNEIASIEKQLDSVQSTK